MGWAFITSSFPFNLEPVPDSRQYYREIDNEGPRTIHSGMDSLQSFTIRHCNSRVDNSQYLDNATGLENVQMVSQIQQKNRQYTKLDGKCELALECI